MVFSPKGKSHRAIMAPPAASGPVAERLSTPASKKEETPASKKGKAAWGWQKLTCRQSKENVVAGFEAGVEEREESPVEPRRFPTGVD